MSEIRSQQSCGPTLSLGEALQAAVQSWINEVAGEPFSRDRERRLDNLSRLFLHVSSFQPYRRNRR